MRHTKWNPWCVLGPLFHFHPEWCPSSSCRRCRGQRKSSSRPCRGSRDNARLGNKKSENDRTVGKIVYLAADEASSHMCWRRQRRPSTERNTLMCPWCWCNPGGSQHYPSMMSEEHRTCNPRSSFPPTRRHRRESSAGTKHIWCLRVLKKCIDTCALSCDLTMAEATRATLMTSPRLDSGISALSRMNKQASSTPYSNYKCGKNTPLNHRMAVYPTEINPLSGQALFNENKIKHWIISENIVKETMQKCTVNVRAVWVYTWPKFQARSDTSSYAPW